MKFWLTFLFLINIAHAKTVSTIEELFDELPKSEEYLTDVYVAGSKYPILSTDLSRENNQYLISSELLKNLGVKNPCSTYPCNSNKKIKINDIKDIELNFDTSNLSLIIKETTRSLPLLERLVREKMIARFRKKEIPEENIKITNTRRKIKLTNRIQYSTDNALSYNQIQLETNVNDFKINYSNKFLFNDATNRKNIIRDWLLITKRFNKGELQIGDYSPLLDSHARERMDASRGAIFTFNQFRNKDSHKIKTYKIEIPAHFDMHIYLNGELFNTYKVSDSDRVINEEVPLRNGLNYVDFKFFGSFGEYFEKNIIDRVDIARSNKGITGRIGFNKERIPIHNKDMLSSEFAEINIPYRNLQLTIGNNRFHNNQVNHNYMYQKLSLYYRSLDYEFMHSLKSQTDKTTKENNKYTLLRHKFNYLVSRNIAINGHYIQSDSGYETFGYIRKDRETLVALRLFNQKLRFFHSQYKGEDTRKILDINNRFLSTKYLDVSNSFQYDLLSDYYRGVLRINPLKYFQFTFIYDDKEFYWKDWRFAIRHKFNDTWTAGVSYQNIVNPYKVQYINARVAYDAKKYMIESSYRTDTKDFQQFQISLVFGFDGNTDGYRIVTNPIKDRLELLTVRPFADLNHNGIKDDNEEFLPNVGIIIGNEKEQMTDSEGKVSTRVRYIANKPIQIGIETPPDNIYLQKEHDIYYTTIQQTMDNELHIPFKPYGEMYGSITKKAYKLNEVIILTHESGEIIELTPDEDGFFMHTKLKPGKYDLKYHKYKKEIVIPSNGGSIDTKISHI